MSSCRSGGRIGYTQEPAWAGKQQSGVSLIGQTNGCKACARTSGGSPMANDVFPVAQRQSPPLDERSLHLRRLVVRALDGGARGHIGSSLSLIEIMRVLYDDILRFRAEAPDWEERDRCILSKGHGCLAQFVMLAEKGFFPHAVLDTFCRRDSILGGHPEADTVPGVEASTGALGHGLP